MDIIAYRIWRPQLSLAAGTKVTPAIVEMLKNDNSAIPGAVADLERRDAYFGLCWMFNPHELTKIRKFYDPEQDIMKTAGMMPLWVYALMPRGVAIHRKLTTGSKKKTGPKCYPPSHFAPRQVFP